MRRWMTAGRMYICVCLCMLEGHEQHTEGANPTHPHHSFHPYPQRALLPGEGRARSARLPRRHLPLHRGGGRYAHVFIYMCIRTHVRLSISLSVRVYVCGDVYLCPHVDRPDDGTVSAPHIHNHTPHAGGRPLLPTQSTYPSRDKDGNPLETEYGLSTYKDHQSVTIQACIYVCMYAYDTTRTHAHTHRSQNPNTQKQRQ